MWKLRSTNKHFWDNDDWGDSMTVIEKRTIIPVVAMLSLVAWSITSQLGHANMKSDSDGVILTERLKVVLMTSISLTE